jgi:hypothetical protein
MKAEGDWNDSGGSGDHGRGYDKLRKIPSPDAGCHFKALLEPINSMDFSAVTEESRNLANQPEGISKWQIEVGVYTS